MSVNSSTFSLQQQTNIYQINSSEQSHIFATSYPGQALSCLCRDVISFERTVTQLFLALNPKCPSISHEFLKKICSLAYTIFPMNRLYFPPSLYGQEVFLVSQKNQDETRVKLYVSLKEKIGAGSTSSVLKAVRLFFRFTSKNLSGFDTEMTAYHITALINQGSRLASENKIALMNEVKGCRQLTQIDEWGHAFDTTGRIYEVFFTKLYQGDIVTYLENTLKIPSYLVSDIRIKNAIFIGYQLGKAIDFLHKKKIVHKDIKIENILVKWGPRDEVNQFKSNELKDDELEVNELELTDLEFACFLTDPKGVQSLQGTYGCLTPEFIALHSTGLGIEGLKEWYESVFKNIQIGAGVDIWAMGLVLYRLFYSEEAMIVQIIEEYSKNRARLMVISTEITQLRTAIQESMDAFEKRYPTFFSNPAGRSGEAIFHDNKIRELIQKSDQTYEEVPLLQANNADLVKNWIAEVIRLHKQQNPRQSDSLNGQIAEVIWKMLQPDPSKRPSAEYVKKFFKKLYVDNIQSQNLQHRKFAKITSEF